MTDLLDINYLVVHTKHNGCYDYPSFEDESGKRRIFKLRINPPKVFMFKTRKQASNFFYDYIQDIDCIDPKCKTIYDTVHQDECSCGVMDDVDDPTLFYNKNNQIFLLENGSQIFMPPYQIKRNIDNFNNQSDLIRSLKRFEVEHTKRHALLCSICEESEALDSDSDEDTDKKSVNTSVKTTQIKVTQAKVTTKDATPINPNTPFVTEQIPLQQTQTQTQTHTQTSLPEKKAKKEKKVVVKKELIDSKKG
jgi:hypothetical protein